MKNELFTEENIIETITKQIESADVWFDYENSEQIAGNLILDYEHLAELEDVLGFSWFDCYCEALVLIEFKYKFILGEEGKGCDIVYSNNKEALLNAVINEYDVYFFEENAYSKEDIAEMIEEIIS